jgi:uncharacterized protein (TIGR03435 family)
LPKKLKVQRLLVFLVTAGLASRAIAPGSTHAQAVAPVSFEVASVKPNTGDSQRVSFGFTVDGYTATNVPLRLLVMSAYGIRPSQVAGGPGWINVTRFDVIARASPGAPRDALMLMLRTLLAERFTLAARLELREQPIYALVLNRADRRPGPQLRPSASECASGRPANPCRISGTIGASAGNVNAIGQTMTEVAAYISTPRRRRPLPARRRRTSLRRSLRRRRNSSDSSSNLLAARCRSWSSRVPHCRRRTE